MSRMVVKKLTLTNFMGDKEKVVELDGDTTISGKHKAGKTTIGTAYSFLFTGKDIYGNELNPMPKDDDGNRKNGLVSSVEGVFEVDGKEFTLKRSVVEKYKKDKVTVNGYTTKYEVNNDDYLANKYNQFLFQLFEEVDYKSFVKKFHLLTSIEAFHSYGVSEKRAELINVAGKVSNLDIINSNKDFAVLLDLAEGDSIDKRDITTKKQIKVLSDEIDEIDPKIEENLKNLPELTDTTEIEAEIKTIDNDILVEKKELAKLDDAITKHNENSTSLFTKRNKLSEIKQTINNNIDAPRIDLEKKQTAARAEYRQLDSSLKDKKEELEDLNKFVVESETKIEIMTKELQSLRDENTETSKTQVKLDDIDCNCPTCKQALPTENIDTLKAEMVANFDRIKAEAIRKVNVKGKALKEQKEALEVQLKDTNEIKIPACKEFILNIKKRVDESIENGKKIATQLENLETAGFVPTKEYTEALEECTKLEETVKNYIAPDKTKIESTISLLQEKKSDLRASMGAKEVYDTLIKRNEELEKLRKDKSDDKMQKEGFIDIVKKFRKIKVQMIEESVKSKFKMVSFKLFEDNLNGEGYKDCCDMMVDGITIKDGLNTASVMNGGLDIINTLSKHYNMCLPVFMDRGESNNTPLEIENQIIELRVSKGAFKVSKMGTK